MINKTPKKYDCGIGMCPTIFEMTPEEYSCGIGACPAIYKTGGAYIIVGKQEDPKNYSLEVQRKIGPGETLVSIPKGLLEKIIEDNQNP